MAAPSVGSVPGSLISWAAGVVGIPATVVAAQINEESGGNLNALSPTGAQGPAQFEPGTWADQGCSGSPNNANDAMKCYAKYMYSLVQQEHGNVRDALAAYNAGPGNLQAGYGYADTILANAGQPGSLTGSGGTGGSGGATLDSASGSDCLIGPFPHTSWCILNKGQGRALIGGSCMVAGALVAVVGLALVAVFALNRSGIGKTIVDMTPAGKLAGKLS
jgi:hypothetical protein